MRRVSAILLMAVFSFSLPCSRLLWIRSCRPAAGAMGSIIVKWLRARPRHRPVPPSRPADALRSPRAKPYQRG